MPQGDLNNKQIPIPASEGMACECTRSLRGATMPWKVLTQSISSSSVQLFTLLPGQLGPGSHLSSRHNVQTLQVPAQGRRGITASMPRSALM